MFAEWVAWSALDNEVCLWELVDDRWFENCEQNETSRSQSVPHTLLERSDWLNTWLHLNYSLLPQSSVGRMNVMSEELGAGKRRVERGDSFTALIFRSIPSCWSRSPSDHLDDEECSDGGFRDFSSRTSRNVLVVGDQVRSVNDRCSSLPSSVNNPASRHVQRKTSVIYHRRPQFSNLRAGHRLLRQSHSVQTFRNNCQHY